MLSVGLTGNIASGKSSVVSVWRRMGATIVDADELSRRAVEPGTPGLAAIRARWGDPVMDSEGRLDRGALREIVFSDSLERQALEAIIHPEVARLRDEVHRTARKAGALIVVSDIPLLYEVGLEDQFDLVVLVDAPEQQRLERLVRMRGLSREAAERMMAAQMPASAKRESADYIIENDGTLDDLEAAALVLWRGLVEQSER
ncbi:dephospho-CoA kinase [soil metagenome]